jgi:hypothetical protein
MNVRLLFIAGLSSSLLCSLSVSAQNYPSRMAVIGDSISRAAVSDDTIDPDQPEHSWATGNSSTDAVNSHFERIRAANPSVIAFNNAENGADSGDLLAQSNTTVSQGVQYVAIQIGGNDICSDNAANITPVATWNARWNEAIDVLQAGLPGADILVTGVVNVRRVYDVGRTNLGCLLKWNVLTFCKSMLTNGSSQRTVATNANINFNNSLAAITAAQGVWYDADTYGIAFSRSQLSNIDCFHPDISLQAQAAQVSYDANRF